MTIVTSSRRASALALAACAAISLPATASARPIDDPALARPAVHQVGDGDGPVLFLSLAGGALAMVVAGGGYFALRGPRVRPVPTVHAR